MFEASMEARRGHWISWSQCYKQLLSCPMWVLGIELRSSAKAVCALSHGAIAPAPYRNLHTVPHASPAVLCWAAVSTRLFSSVS